MTPLHSSPPVLRLLAMALLGLSLSTAALSTRALADEKPGANKALRRAQMEAAKAQQEKAAVEAEKATLASELEKVQNEAKKNEAAQKQARGALASLQKALSDARARADALQAQDEAHLTQSREAQAETVKAANERFERYEADITALRQRVAESDAHGRELERKTQALEEDKSRLTADLGERGESLAACTKKNGELFTLNEDLRKKYQDKGLLSLLKRGEPLTGLSRVQEENALQDAEDKAQDARIVPGSR